MGIPTEGIDFPRKPNPICLGAQDSEAQPIPRNYRKMLTLAHVPAPQPRHPAAHAASPGIAYTRGCLKSLNFDGNPSKSRFPDG